jgi:hypothetical protein
MANLTASGVWITDANAGFDYKTRLFVVLFQEK